MFEGHGQTEKPFLKPSLRQRWADALAHFYGEKKSRNVSKLVPIGVTLQE